MTAYCEISEHYLNVQRILDDPLGVFMIVTKERELKTSGAHCLT
jgi:hypothetical protein